MVVLNRIPIVLILLLAAANAAVAQGSGDEVKVGFFPPELPSKVNWIGEAPDTQGSPVRLLLFWEPSYTGSRIAVPIMSQLQKRWGTDRLQVLGYGIEVTQQHDYDKEPIPTVEPWIVKHATRIKFPVGSVKQADLSRTWLKKRQSPFLLLVVLGRDGAVQGIMNPLDEGVNQLVAKLVTGRYDVFSEQWAAPYKVEIENYRRLRDWTQYKRVVDILTEGGHSVKSEVGYFVEEELDFLVSALTEQDDPQLAATLVQGWIEDRSETDPDFLGMLAERLANDPAIPDDRRMLADAAKAAKSSYDSADTSEGRARALGRMALVSSRQGNSEVARKQAKQAYRIAPPHLKSELKERWLYVKQRTADGV